MALHPSPPQLRKAKIDSVQQNGPIEDLQLETAKVLAGTPKKSILSFDDLQSVNPNPTILPTPVTSPVQIAEEAVAKPKRKRGPKAKSSEQAMEQEIITTAVKSIEPKKRLTPLRKQILELEATYPDCVLLVRVGEFYEVGLGTTDAQSLSHLSP
jgi:hypothetical protein